MGKGRETTRHIRKAATLSLLLGFGMKRIPRKDEVA